jgi:hypothetical protein
LAFTQQQQAWQSSPIEIVYRRKEKEAEHYSYSCPILSVFAIAMGLLGMHQSHSTGKR